jgi:hypothetical protein
MKKFTTIFLAGALVFAAAGQASAALETSGEFRARAWYLKNYVASDKSTEMWDQRLRLNLDWPIAEGVKVHARADLNEGMWGDTILDPPTTVDGSIVASPKAAKNPAVAWDHMNLEFAVPQTPVAITVGRQNANWGTGNWVGVDNRDRFKITAKFGDTVALYTYDKYTEVFGLHDTLSLDDRRQHSVGVVSKLAGWNVGLIYGIVLDETNPTVDFMLNGFDGYAMGKIGPVTTNFEVAYAVGTNDFAAAGVPDQDLSGMLVYGGVFMPVSALTLGFEGCYAAGDDPTTTKNEGSLRTDYNSPFWSVILFNNFDYNGFQNESIAGATDTGLTNAWAGKVSVKWAPSPALSIYGAALYASRDQVKDGVDEAMGTEFDLTATYAITPNVSLTLGGGYLMAGDYYNTGLAKDIEDPWGAVCAFTTKF